MPSAAVTLVRYNLPFRQGVAQHLFDPRVIPFAALLDPVHDLGRTEPGVCCRPWEAVCTGATGHQLRRSVMDSGWTELVVVMTGPVPAIDAAPLQVGVDGRDSPARTRRGLSATCACLLPLVGE